ncbi:nuclear transport factor 2 family protein [Neobacillus piezotolerans]|uniref:Nuclear transport factor 2 family protein n=1 Tax=Neobacillus piezotolerans TaxID=2259171 RepID=A0A3D8GM38_9BACI|nr:nuclear transport factor 2 family protein [Neobacillus piezotolerans]RDU35279.1 nuclear transport factor 2 family protein [Neobacillus piezotolerans]
MMKERASTSSPSPKEMAVSFLQLVVSGKIREAYQEYIADEFRHHNPYFPGDADSLMAAMEENAVQSPQKTLEVKLAVHERDIVVVHSHIKQKPNDPGAVVVHIFRFKDDKIVELWDVGQPVPEDSPNENGIF